MTKIITADSFPVTNYIARCKHCDCQFEYEREDVYEKMEVPRWPAAHDPYGYIRNVVDCPKCKWQVSVG